MDNEMYQEYLQAEKATRQQLAVIEKRIAEENKKAVALWKSRKIVEHNECKVRIATLENMKKQAYDDIVFYKRQCRVALGLDIENSKKVSYHILKVSYFIDKLNEVLMDAKSAIIAYDERTQWISTIEKLIEETKSLYSNSANAYGDGYDEMFEEIERITCHAMENAFNKVWHEKTDNDETKF